MAPCRGCSSPPVARQIGPDLPVTGPDPPPTDKNTTTAVVASCVTLVVSAAIICGICYYVKYRRIRRRNRGRRPGAEDGQGDEAISLEFALRDLQPPNHNDSGGTRVVISPASSESSRISPMHGTPSSLLPGQAAPTTRPLNDFTRALSSNPVTESDLVATRSASEQPARVPPRRRVGRARRGNSYPPPAGRRLRGPRRRYDIIPESRHEHTFQMIPLSPPVTLSTVARPEVTSQELTIPVSESEADAELPVGREVALDDIVSPRENTGTSSRDTGLHVTFSDDPFSRAPLRDLPVTPTARTVLKRRRSQPVAESGSNDPQIVIERPRSFMINDWPLARTLSQGSSDAATSASVRLQEWHTPPSDHIIEQSRLARQKLEFIEKAKQVITERARDENEQLSEEQIDAHAIRMWERSSQYKLSAIAYDPERSQLKPLEPAFASSQVLPLAASPSASPTRRGHEGH
ncbi:hypothetical protein NPX13_g3571 [Xylaria arbuscula]|uniref:Uncharacterized protein n=1 Tax=Xylaria arbuscula TaxID=114810 RepID=A0A9W8NHZ8_9PEZI|nr:hypothetical protein NPX13_g3571 [Xylaria arbuscula]